VGIHRPIPCGGHPRRHRAPPGGPPGAMQMLRHPVTRASPTPKTATDDSTVNQRTTTYRSPTQQPKTPPLHPVTDSSPPGNAGGFLLPGGPTCRPTSPLLAHHRPGPPHPRTATSLPPDHNGLRRPHAQRPLPRRPPRQGRTARARRLLTHLGRERSRHLVLRAADRAVAWESSKTLRERASGPSGSEPGSIGAGWSAGSRSARPAAGAGRPVSGCGVRRRRRASGPAAAESGHRLQSMARGRTDSLRFISDAR
jgi:hypothetical protein